MGLAVIPIVPASQWLAARQRFVAPVPEPVLQGPQELLAKVLGGLSGVIDPAGGGNVVEGRWIRALHLNGDEAELTLAADPRSARGAWLAEESFQALRRLLPDTDVYVRAA